MLNESQKSELELYRREYDPTVILVRLRDTRDPDYLAACDLVLATLRRLRDVPAKRRAAFYVSFDYRVRRTVIECLWHDGPRDFIQFIGNAIRHPEPMPAEPAPRATETPKSMPAARKPIPRLAIALP